MKNITEQYKCQSWYDGESDRVKDCTCGKCQDAISKKFTKEEIMMAEHMQRAWFATVTKETHKDWIRLSESLMKKIKTL